MITREKYSEKINFKRNGVQYTMTIQEIEAACYYQKHLYRLEDACNHFDIFVFGYDSGMGFDTPESIRKMEDFAEEYGISYDEAASENMLEKYLQWFEDRLECGNDENSQWEMAIWLVLEELKKK